MARRILVVFMLLVDGACLWLALADDQTPVSRLTWALLAALGIVTAWPHIVVEDDES